MRLRDVFVEFLKEKGIDRISTSSFKVLDEDPIQYIARKFAAGEFRIVEGRGRYCFDLNGNFSDSCSYVAGRFRDGIANIEISERLSEFPFIAIDCSLKYMHSEKELSSLKKQIQSTLSVIRKYMWDDRLAVAGLDVGISCRKCSRIEDFLSEMNFEKVILLDPNSEDVFQGEKADCYIIGGIVDRSGNKKGTTGLIYRKLAENGFDVKRKKIHLRGDVVGVPDRINHITEIILKCILDGLDTERAIYDVQNRKIARWRLRKEIAKNAKKIEVSGKKFRAIEKSFFENTRKWLKISEDDFYRCAMDMGVMVLDDTLTSAKVLKIHGSL